MTKTENRSLDDFMAATTETSRQQIVAEVETFTSKLSATTNVTLGAGWVHVLLVALRTADENAGRLANELVDARRVAEAYGVDSHFNPQSCENCHFSAVVSAGHGELDPHVPGSKRVVACRRSPPTLRVVGGGETEVLTSMFPPVHPQNWCGAWALMTSKRAGV